MKRNPLRAELVAWAEHWKWSSLAGRHAGDAQLWRAEPAPQDPAWRARVNEPLSVGDLARLRESVARERPFGTEDWTRRTAERLGLEFTLRGRGRPRKQ